MNPPHATDDVGINLSSHSDSPALVLLGSSPKRAGALLD
jgi:hypothetical protein